MIQDRQVFSTVTSYVNSEVAAQMCYLIISVIKILNILEKYEVKLVKLGNECLQLH